MKFKVFFPGFIISIVLYACNNNTPPSNNTIPETPVAKAETPKAEIRGQVVFEQKCASCHGNDGTAGIGNAANLQASKLNSASITKIIREGKGGMPAFGSQLTKKEIADVSNYVLALRK